MKSLNSHSEKYCFIQKCSIYSALLTETFLIKAASLTSLHAFTCLGPHSLSWQTVTKFSPETSLIFTQALKKKKKEKEKKRKDVPHNRKDCLKNTKCAQCPPPSGWLPRRRDRGATGSWCKEEMSGCLVPASSQMFCGSLCKPTCICLLAFQNVCYRCIYYGLGRSRTPGPPNKPRDCDGRYFNAGGGAWSCQTAGEMWLD